SGQTRIVAWPAQSASLVDTHPRPPLCPTYHPSASRGVRVARTPMRATETMGFFTLGVPLESYSLPHPRLGLPVILLIRRVLLRAFELLREQNFNLSEATEDQVTAALRSTIENNLRQNGAVP